MVWFDQIVSFLTGIGLRLLVPVILTGLAVYLLRRLDARWQVDASLKVQAPQKPECWNVKGCSEEKRKSCKGANSAEPCWQAFRGMNGYLKEECLGCKVFHQAPVPIQI